MKTILHGIFVLLLFISADIHAQAYKDSIRNQFVSYTNCLIAKDYEGSADFINPDFFKIITREQLVAMMEKTMNNPELELRIGSPEIVSIEDVKTVGKMNYAKFSYNGDLGMRFLSGDVDTKEALDALKSQFGDNHVKYDESTGFFRIRMIKNVVANSADQKTWTFVVVEPRQIALLEKFIPKELL